MKLHNSAVPLLKSKDWQSESSGVSIPETIVVIGLIGSIICLIFPLMLHTREASRLHSCQNNLRILTEAVRCYHDTYRQLPPAAFWDTNATASIALHRSNQIELITRQNWVQLILSYIGEASLSEQFDPLLPIGDVHHLHPRTTRLKAVTCASDPHNNLENFHQYFPSEDSELPITFARGNYAINGGTQYFDFVAPSTSHPNVQYGHLLLDNKSRLFQLWGNGLAGINKTFSYQDFSNGQSTMIALEEIRAGVHPLDPRGTWALGQLGASITGAHGVNGDDYGPNNQWNRADDILGGGILHEVLGATKLQQEEMPCVSYIDRNQQATARSKHSGGVNVSFLDGSVRFISDNIDSSLWHVMHSR